MAQTETAPLATVDVSGSLQNRAGKTLGGFQGVLAIQEFAYQDGRLVAIGTLSGEVVKQNGNTKESLDAVAVSVPVTEIEGTESVEEGEAALQASCQILGLSLGPLDLDLLGLMVHLDEVNLDISADPAGGLLGDLLCGIADLLGGTLDDLLGDVDFLTDVLQFAGLLGDFLDILNSLGTSL